MATRRPGVGTVRAATLIALRSRSAILVAFVAPFTLAGILSFALGGGADFTTTIGVVDADGGPVAAALVSPFQTGDLADAVTVRGYTDRIALRRAVAGGEVAAGLVLPAGLSQAISGGGTAPVEVLRNPSAPVSGEVVEGVVSAVAARADAQRQAVASAIAAGAPASSAGDLAEAAQGLVRIVNDGAGTPLGEGNGLAGLAERARAVSGSAVAQRTRDGQFRLVVEVPAEIA